MKQGRKDGQDRRRGRREQLTSNPSGAPLGNGTRPSEKFQGWRGEIYKPVLSVISKDCWEGGG